MGVDLSPHKYKINEQTGLTTLKRSVPYRRFQAKGKPDVYLQNGLFWYSETDSEPIPDDELRKLGFDPDSEVEPTSMPEHPKIKAILEDAAGHNLEDWAHELAGTPHHRRKVTRVIEKE